MTEFLTWNNGALLLPAHDFIQKILALLVFCLFVPTVALLVSVILEGIQDDDPMSMSEYIVYRLRHLPFGYSCYYHILIGEPPSYSNCENGGRCVNCDFAVRDLEEGPSDAEDFEAF